MLLHRQIHIQTYHVQFNDLQARNLRLNLWHLFRNRLNVINNESKFVLFINLFVVLEYKLLMVSPTKKAIATKHYR